MAAKPIVPSGPAVVDFVCGLRKVGPQRYSLVTGKVVNGVPELKVDEAAQKQEFAAEELRIAMQKLMAEIP